MKKIIIKKSKQGYSLQIGSVYMHCHTLEESLIKIMAEKTSDVNLFRASTMSNKDIRLLSKMLAQEFRKLGLIAKDIVENNYDKS